MNTQKICHLLFSKLNKNKIQYCHWKSNIRLDKALSGKTDLDLLVHQNDKDKFLSIAKNLKFKEILSPKNKRYPEMEDYLGFDKDSGNLCHLHVHYQMITGPKYTKNYHISIENTIFKNLIYKGDLQIPCPEFELLIFIIRSFLKFDIKDLIINLIKRNPLYFSSVIIDEYKYLLKDINEDKFRQVIISSGILLSHYKLLQLIENIKKGQIKIINFLLLKRHIIKKIKQYKIINRKKTAIALLFYYIKTIKIIKKLTQAKKKTLIKNNGKIFALVGADGSGKSTLQKDLIKWLSWKLEVKNIYFGIPKSGSTKLFNLIIKYVSYLEKSFKGKFLLLKMKQIVSNIRWLYIAKKRFSLFKFSKELSSQGTIVITDRYPMKHFTQMENPMDGPRINIKQGEKVNFFAKVERKSYLDIELPNQFFVIKTDIDKLRRRKPEVEIQIHKKKAEAVNSIHSNSQITEIDGNKSYEEVLHEIKCKMWELL